MTTMKYCLRLALLMLCLAALPASATTQASNTAGQDRPAPLAMDQDNLEVVGHLSSVVTSVAVQGNYAYIGGGYEFAVLALDNPARPQRLGYVLLPDSVGAIAAADDHAYVLLGSGALGVVDVSRPAAPKLVATVGVPVQPVVSDIAVAGRFIYVSGTTGLHIFDRFHPAAPTAVGMYAPPGVALGDLDVSDRYVYVSASPVSGTSGIRIVDVGNPAAPVEVGSYTRPGVAMPRVVVRGFYAYIGSSKGLRIVDVSVPEAPAEVSVTPLPGPVPFLGYNLVVLGNYAYLATESVWNPSLSVVDVSQPAATKVGGPIALPAPGDASSVAMASAGQFMYLALRNSGLVAFTTATPSAPAMIGAYRPIGFSTNLAVQDQYAYFAQAGLRIVNIVDPAAPFVVGAYDAPRKVSFTAIAVAGRYTYLGGLFYDNFSNAHFRIVDVANPAAPAGVGALTLPGEAVRDIIVRGSYAYLMTEKALHIVDVSNPTAPRVDGTYNQPDGTPTFRSSAMADNYVYISSSSSISGDSVHVVDVANPYDPREVSRVGHSGNLAIEGHYLYIASSICPTFGPCYGTLWVVDITTPLSPMVVGMLDEPLAEITVAASRVYAIRFGSPNLQVIDVSLPSSPRVIGDYDLKDGYTSLFEVEVVGNMIYLATQYGLSILKQNEFVIGGQITHANRAPAPVKGVQLVSSAGKTAESGPDGTYAFPKMFFGIYSIKPTLEGYTFWPVTRTVTLPPSGSGVDFVILPGPVSTTLTAGTAATLAFTDTQGLRTQLDFSSGVVSETTTLIVTPTMAVDGPRMVFAGHAFDLLALRGGTPMPDFSFNLPMTVTLRYSGADLRFVSDKRQVGLWWWNGNGWEQSSELCVSALPPTHDQANKILRVPVCRTGRLALLGPTHRIQLPTIAHAAPSS